MTQADRVAENRDDVRRIIAERDELAAALAASRRREDLLVEALHHRVRNTLAIVRSMFSRTVESAPSLDHVVIHLPGRIDTLARYQARSAVLPDPAFDLETMVCDELMVFAAAADPRVTVSGPEVRLTLRQAESFALALHELAANSIKFGVLAAPAGSGRLTIAWTLAGDRLAFAWTEEGVAVVSAAPIARGFGREYIEQALPYQLGAETSLELIPGGISCRIAVAVEPVEPSAD